MHVFKLFVHCSYKFKNTQVIADKFAEAGFLTIVPDQFAGEKCVENRSQIRQLEPQK